MRRILSPVGYLLVAFALSCFFAAPLPAQEPFQKGICFVTWEKERFSSPHAEESLRALAKIGAQWICIVVTQYQETYNSTGIFPTGQTASDESLLHIIRRAHRLGLKVMLKPHLDLRATGDGMWRGDICFHSEDQWRAWSAAYLAFILHYARLAQQAGAQMFCVGTELRFASGRTQLWEEEIIPRVRAIYKGKLVYAANWDEYKRIAFWRSLDYIGIDAYFPLAEKEDPGYEEIRQAWRRWADEIEAWQKTVNKPVIFTEIGYTSCAYTAARPWETGYGKRLSLELQADCYKAALETLCGRKWCEGMYWWYWKPSPYAGGTLNRDFTPQNKPAELVLASWYSFVEFVR